MQVISFELEITSLNRTSNDTLVDECIDGSSVNVLCPKSSYSYGIAHCFSDKNPKSLVPSTRHSVI